MFVIELLGRFRVVSDHGVVEHFDTKRSALLLAKLALAGNQPLNRDELADMLWPDDFLDATRGRLRQELARLRRCMGDGASIILADRERIQLDLDITTTDIAAFETSLHAASMIDELQAREAALKVAISRYTGELLPGFGDAWILPERKRLRELYVSALLDLATCFEKTNRFPDMLETAKTAVAAMPKSQAAHHTLMRAMVGLGDSSLALNHFELLQRKLTLEHKIEINDKLRAYVESLRSPSPVAIPEPEIAETTLPAVTERLFGREAELRRGLALLDPNESTRLVTLTGPGGIGKTRLAMEIGHRLTQTYKGKIWFVDLSQLTHEDDIAGVILDTMKVDHRDRSQDKRTLHASIPRSTCLLILDNYEQITDGPKFVQEMIQAHPQLRILLTSRQLMGLGAENELPVQSLPVPEHESEILDLLEYPSVALFVSRAKSVRPQFDLAASGPRAVADLVRRLEGIPLAIHLAAARASVLTPTEMLQQLEKPFDFLVSRRSDLDTRHRTLRATLEWSYRLLTPDLQQAFRELSVFRGGWNLQSAAAVCQSGTILDLLEQLRERSLVMSYEGVSGMRFRMLEVVRELALEQMSAEELDSVRKSHCAYFTQLMQLAEQKMMGPEQKVWYEIVAEEYENIREALGWCSLNARDQAFTILANTWRFWTVRGYQKEGREWQNKILNDVPIVEKWELGYAFFGAGVLAYDQSDWQEAIRWYGLARSVCQKMGNERGMALMDLNEASIYRIATNFQKSKELFERSLQGYSKEPSMMDRATCLSYLGLTMLGLDQPDQAMAAMRESLRIRLDLGESWGISDAKANLGTGHFETGDLHEARRFLQEGADGHRAMPDLKNTAKAVEGLALVHLALGDTDSAEACAIESLEIRRRLGDRHGIAFSTYIHGRIALERGDYFKAGEYFDGAMSIWERLNHAPGVIDCVSELSRIALLKGEVSLARTLFAATERLICTLEIGMMPSCRARYGALHDQVVQDQPNAERLSIRETVSTWSLNDSADYARRVRSLAV